MPPDIDPVAHNREAWDRFVAQGNEWTQPVTSEVIARAREGDWSVVLIGYEPVPREWFPAEMRGLDVLALRRAADSKDQCSRRPALMLPLLDNSPAQLAQDRLVADRDGLMLRDVLGDMRDLSQFGDESFDVVFHPVSNLFCPDVRTVWSECFRVLRPDGLLLAGFLNPDIFIFDQDAEDNRGELIVRHSLPYSDLTSITAEEREKLGADQPISYSHTMTDQIGGQLEAGFVITAFAELPHHASITARYMPGYYATRAVKPQQ